MTEYSHTYACPFLLAAVIVSTKTDSSDEAECRGISCALWSQRINACGLRASEDVAEELAFIAGRMFNP